MRTIVRGNRMRPPRRLSAIALHVYGTGRRVLCGRSMPNDLLPVLPVIERHLGLARPDADTAYIQSQDAQWLVRPSVLLRRLCEGPLKPYIVPILSRKGLARLTRSYLRGETRRLPVVADVLNIRPGYLTSPRVLALYPYQRRAVAVKIVNGRRARASLEREVMNAAIVRELGVLAVPFYDECAAFSETSYIVSEYVHADIPSRPAHRRMVVEQLLPQLFAHYQAYGIQSVPAQSYYDDAFFDQLDCAFSRVGRNGDPSVRGQIAELRRYAREGGDLSVSFCHSDLNVSHIGIRKADGRVVLIDWESAGVKPIGYDLARVAKMRVGDGPDLFEEAMGVMDRIACASGKRGQMVGRRQLILGAIHPMKWWLNANRSALEHDQEFTHPDKLKKFLKAVAAMMQRG